MKKIKLITRILIIALVVIFTLLFLSMFIVCIAMIIPYWGKTMGNEASGFFNMAFTFTILIGIITFILWKVFLKQNAIRNNQIKPKE